VGELSEVSLKNANSKWLTSQTAGAIAAAASEGFKSPPAPQDSWEAVSLVNTPGDATWPIVTFSYMFVHEDLTAQGDEGGLIKSYLEVLFTDEGQTAAQSYGFTKLPASVIALNKEGLKRLKLANGVGSFDLRPPRWTYSDANAGTGGTGTVGTGINPSYPNECAQKNQWGPICCLDVCPSPTGCATCSATPTCGDGTPMPKCAVQSSTGGTGTGSLGAGNPNPVTPPSGGSGSSGMAEGTVAGIAIGCSVVSVIISYFVFFNMGKTAGLTEARSPIAKTGTAIPSSGVQSYLEGAKIRLSRSPVRTNDEIALANDYATQKMRDQTEV